MSEKKEMLALIRNRRSVRKYQDKALEKETVEKIVEAGRYAPSGGNNQTTHFIVIADRNILQDLCDRCRDAFSGMEITEGMYKSLQGAITSAKKGNNNFFYHAPVLVVTANRKGYGNAMADSACALENMMIAASALDVGSVWINQLHWLDEHPLIREAMAPLGLTDEETICGAVALGYAEGEIGQPLPRHGNPVTWIGFDA